MFRRSLRATTAPISSGIDAIVPKASQWSSTTALVARGGGTRTIRLSQTCREFKSEMGTNVGDTKTVRVSKENREHTLAACNFLVSGDVSTYRQVVQDHEAALATGDVGSFLPRTTQVKKHLECALWPNLYPTSTSCDNTLYGRQFGKDDCETGLLRQSVFSGLGLRSSIWRAAVPF